jgi:hypothetical protein
MAFGSDRSANFVIKAKDAATGPLGKIGGAMGKLKGAAGAAFKAIAAGAAAAATAIAGFAIAGIKAAVEDEQQTIRLNAALKARGFALDQLGPKVEEQIKAMQRLGFSDDQVRSGLEVGSRFFKNQENLLRANAVAANIAAVTGKDLATVMLAIGRGAAGSTRGLMSLGIEVEKGAKLKDILRAADEKYAGTAEELANSTAGKFAAAQITFNEQIEALGYRFLPAVSTAMDFLAKNVLPMTDKLFGILGDTITGFAGKLTEKGGVADSVLAVVGPIAQRLAPAIGDVGKKIGELLGSIGELVVALWDDGDGPLAIAVTAIGGLFEGFVKILGFVVDTIKLVIDIATEALQLLDRLGGSARRQTGQPTFTGGGGAYGGGGGGQQGMSPYPTGPIGANVVIGTNAMSSLDLYLGTQARVSTGRQTGGRP